MLRNGLWAVFAIGGFVIGSYATAQVGVEPAAESSVEVELQKAMLDDELITMVGRDLVKDQRLGMMLGHEVLVQKMLANEEFVKKIQHKFKVDRDPAKRKKELEKFSSILTTMMADKESARRVLKDVMIRQIAKYQMTMDEETEAP